ncbi:DeoR/GlpR family DNA-binding transcription regulator [Kistimonas scapharcae]|uniref:DeoR/GlpR family DNA-binding transcription regulator n=1 Tax=Kistimonas scapharcae TaxID=1036133 RepID=A0ABP8V610_9GAMM
MLAIERRERILSYLRQHEYANVETLAGILDVSSMTIRRDLTKLEEQGMIRRTHGGATIGQFINTQPHSEESKSRCPEEKHAIASYAASLVSDGQSILLDAGTTCMEIARQLVDRRIRVVTTDLAQALFLCRYRNIEVHIAGGQVDERTQSSLGGNVQHFLDDLNVELAFIGCTSWDLQRGVTTPTEDRAELKRKMFERAGTRILVADSEKYGRYSFHRIMGLEKFDLVVTDSHLPDYSHETLIKAEINLHLVSA